ncbi:MAG: membrane protein insertase YidC [Candidatus Electryonea clarkiae]|nr:membrane protein insertase YidC [Candidatus Electryonea clarkiae]MDP8288958.1 membrane protein insertase YidC [Candidatus Electryonea clarkiae]
MDKRTVLAFVVIGIILMLMPQYYKLVSPPKETSDSTALEQDKGTYQPETRPYQERQDRFPASGDHYDSTPQTTDFGSFDTGDSLSSSGYGIPEKEIKIETPLYEGVFSTRGAIVKSWIIKPTQPYLHEPEELVRQRDTQHNLELIARGGRGLLRTSEKNFTANKNTIKLDESKQSDTLIFTLQLNEVTTYSEIFVFHYDTYVVDIYIESKGLGDLTKAANVVFSWGGGIAQTEMDSAQDLFYTEASFLMGKKKENFKTKGKKASEEQATGPTTWVAQRNKYFLFAMVPERPAAGVKLYTWPDSLYNGKYPPKLLETGLIFNLFDGDISRHITLYFGPLEQSFLNNVDPSLEQTMNWGWPIIKPFSKGVLWTLKKLHKVIPNYGLVLIIFSILIKIIVWPLTHKAHQSTKRMQVLQPLIKSIQAKYKSEPQRMQKEVMGLYKEHKVNPAGGCWPMLLQMPLLYSLFIVFRSTIELRGAPFILWISDLSMPDILFELPFSIPLYGDHVCVLPLVMALSTFLQSKMTMTDPNQKMMLYMMPVMFVFLFNNFPSGLTLYYTLFNLLSWAQQRMMKVKDPQLEAQIEKAREDDETAAKRLARRKGGGKR